MQSCAPHATGCPSARTVPESSDTILIRDLPDDVVAILDQRAAALGLSRNEYLRRHLRQLAVRSPAAVTVDDLRRFEDLTADLDNPEVMDRAWS